MEPQGTVWGCWETSAGHGILGSTIIKECREVPSCCWLHPPPLTPPGFLLCHHGLGGLIRVLELDIACIACMAAKECDSLAYRFKSLRMEQLWLPGGSTRGKQRDVLLSAPPPPGAKGGGKDLQASWSTWRPLLYVPCSLHHTSLAVAQDGVAEPGRKVWPQLEDGVELSGGWGGCRDSGRPSTARLPSGLVYTVAHRQPPRSCANRIFHKERGWGEEVVDAGAAQQITYRSFNLKKGPNARESTRAVANRALIHFLRR